MREEKPVQYVLRDINGVPLAVGEKECRNKIISLALDGAELHKNDKGLVILDDILGDNRYDLYRNDREVSPLILLPEYRGTFRK